MASSKVQQFREEIGGYDYEFVDPIPEDFTCPICTLVQREAHQVTCCGKIYCKSCLDQLKKKGDEVLCPSCRANLKGEESKFFPDKNAASKIKHLRIHCTNKERGCQWVGHLKDLDKEHLPKCPNEFVFCGINKTTQVGKCIPAKCGVKVQRHQLEKHMTKECEWRRVTCLCCKKIGSYRHILEHVRKECPDVLLPCGNEGCQEKIKRRLMAYHHKVCPKQIVSCRYISVGCRAKLKREDVSTHDQECMGNHLENAVTTIEHLRSENEDLRCEIGPVVTVRMPGLTRHCTDVMSLGFYTSKGGYKFRLKGELLSVFFYKLFKIDVAAMPGRYDDILEWPANGKITIELLNQKRNEDHKVITSDITINERIIAPKENGEWIVVGSFDVPVFAENQSYISNDTAYFRISVQWNLKYEVKAWLY